MRDWVKLYPGMVLHEMAGLTPAEAGVLFIVTMLNFSDQAAISPLDKRLKFYSQRSRPRLQKIIDRLSRSGAVVSIPTGEIYTALADRMISRAEADSARPAIPLAIRRAVFKRDGMICAYCDDGEGPFELDHRIPWSRGGDHAEENLCVACRDCNRAKYNRTEGEFING